MKFTKKIDKMKTNPAADKHELQILYDKRREFYSRFHDCKFLRATEKVLINHIKN